MDVYASMAWVKASTPVATVTSGGTVRVNTGSMTAKSAMSLASLRSIFTSVSVLVIIETFVASEPVPAVVGIATVGEDFFQSLCPYIR